MGFNSAFKGLIVIDQGNCLRIWHVSGQYSYCCQNGRNGFAHFLTFLQ